MRSFSITQPSLSFTPSAPSNLLTPVTQSMSVNSPVQMSSFTQPSLPSTPWVMSAHSPVLSNPTHSPLLSNPTGSVIQVTQPLSANQATILPPPFNTPPKLLLVEQVMRDYPGNYVASFRWLTIALAHKASFEKQALSRSSLSGNNNIGPLDKQKLDYIKAVVRSTVPTMPAIQFEGIWDKCLASLSKVLPDIENYGKEVNTQLIWQKELV